MRANSCVNDEVDERYESASDWAISDLSILQENGVYDLLMEQEPVSVYGESSELMGGTIEASIRSNIKNHLLTLA